MKQAEATGRSNVVVLRSGIAPVDAAIQPMTDEVAD
jgi:hypothetical protein